MVMGLRDALLGPRRDNPDVRAYQQLADGNGSAEDGGLTEAEFERFRAAERALGPNVVNQLNREARS